MTDTVIRETKATVLLRDKLVGSVPQTVGCDLRPGEEHEPLTFMPMLGRRHCRRPNKDRMSHANVHVNRPLEPHAGTTP